MMTDLLIIVSVVDNHRMYGDLLVIIITSTDFILIFSGPILSEVKLDHDIRHGLQICLQMLKLAIYFSDPFTMWPELGHLGDHLCHKRLAVQNLIQQFHLLDDSPVKLNFSTFPLLEVHCLW